MSATEARYPGYCGDCGARIQIGEQITPTTEHPSTDYGRALWAHTQCPDNDPLQAPDAPCPDCHLTHKGECY